MKKVFLHRQKLNDSSFPAQLFPSISCPFPRIVLSSPYKLILLEEPDTVLARTLGEITVSASERILSTINYGL